LYPGVGFPRRPYQTTARAIRTMPARLTVQATDRTTGTARM